MSHELRTPLNGILGYAQILQRDREASPKQKDGLSIIYQCGSHLLTLINDILDIAKIEAKKLELQPTEFHFERFLQSIVEICRIKAEQKEIEFIYKASNPLPIAICADEKRLRQVLLNLLGNAIKFTEKGSVSFSVISHHRCAEVVERSRNELAEASPVNPPVLRTPPLIREAEGIEQPTTNNHQPTTKIRFVVEDTGVGLNLEQLKKIFLPFEQVGDRARQDEGTGLGLAITQQIVEMMGSIIEVESTSGEGSRFEFELAVPEAFDWKQTNAIARPKTPSAYRFQPVEKSTPLTLLIVDDRLENRLVFVNLLAPLGFAIMEAENGQVGWNRALECSPDLIITDLAMPVMNGLEMTQKLRQLEAFKNIPIIASSASVFNFDRQQSQDAGCNDFLPKPVQAEELFEQLQRYLPIAWQYGEEPEATEEGDDLEIIPPHSELIALYNAARDGHIAGIEAEAYRIQDLDSQYKVFANKILQWTENLEDEKILQFLESYQLEN